MPIIKNPLSHITVQPPVESIGSQKKPDVEKGSGRESIAKPKNPEKPKNSLLSITLFLILGLVTPAGIYWLYTFVTAPSSGDLSQIQINITTVEKIGALASIAKQEYEANFISLSSAQEAGSQVVVSALEIIVQKNRKSLIKYKQKFLQSILDLHKNYVQAPKHVSQSLRIAIDDAESKQSEERMRILKMVLQTIQNTPTSNNNDISKYITESIENSL